MNDERIPTLEDGLANVVENMFVWYDNKFAYPTLNEIYWMGSLRAALAAHRKREAERDAEVEKLRETVTALAKLWVAVHDWRVEVTDAIVKGDYDKVKELAVLEYPVLQGHKNQMNIRKLAEGDVDHTHVAETISHLIAEAKRG